MVFDRSKFQKSKVDEIDGVVKSAFATMRNPETSGGYAKFFAISDPGKYCFRILPSTTGKAYVPCKTVKLEVEKYIYKDGEKTDKKELKMSDIFTSDIHSTRMGGKDAALIYQDYVYELASEIQDQDERKKFLYPLTGFRGRDGKWVWGLSPMLNFVSYVAPYPIINNDIYRLNLQPKWWNRMKEISLDKSNDDVLSIDVFSDPEEGYPLTIKFDMENKKRSYVLDALEISRGQSWDDFFAETTVPDSILEKLAGLPSLDELYVDVFSRKDWDFEMEGLQRLDEKSGYNIFSNEQFLDELEALEKLVPEDDEVKSAQEKKVAPETKPVESKARPAAKKTEPAKTEEKTYPSLIKMKAELNKYIEVEYENTEVLPAGLSIVELRKWYDLMKAGEMLPFDEYKTEGEEEAEEDNLPFEKGAEEDNNAPADEPASTSPKTESARERLKRLREEAAARR